MRMMILAAGLAGLALSGCAPMDGPGYGASGARECFYVSHARSFSGGEDGRIYVRTGVHEVFELQTVGFCPDIDWTHRIGLDPRGSNRVCTGFDLDLIVEDPVSGPNRCMVRTVRRLSDEEAAARR